MQRIFFGSSNGQFLIDWAMINGWQYKFTTEKEMEPSSVKADAEKGIEVPTGKTIRTPVITLLIKDSQPVNLDPITTAEFMEFLKTRDMRVWTINNRIDGEMIDMGIGGAA